MDLTQNLGEAEHVEAELLDHELGKTGNSQCVDRNAASAFSFEGILDGAEFSIRKWERVQSLDPLCDDGA